MFNDVFEQNKYDDTFEKIYKDLKYQLSHDERYGIEDLEKLLESMYVYEGQDWIGRGGIKAIVNSATIAAINKVLIEYREEISE